MKRFQSAFSILVLLAAISTLFAFACSDASDDEGQENPADGDESDDPSNYACGVVPAKLTAQADSACVDGYIETPPQAGLNENFTVSNQAREFFLALPENQNAPAPLLVAFNGTGGDGQGFFESAHLQDFVDAGFIVAAPSSNANGHVWPVWDGMRLEEHFGLENPDLDLFDTLVQCLGAHYEIDMNRIYITGHSAGGIFANYVLRHRSEMLAGGIPASGIIDNTGEGMEDDLDDMVVIVAWGGEDDFYEGDSDGEESVAGMDFNVQASLASLFYYNEPNVMMARASMEVGHKFLHQMNAWFIEVLLSYPKGCGLAGEFSIPDAPEGVDAVVSTEPYEIETTTLECPSAETQTCTSYCQFIADCVVVNDTLRPALSAELMAAGFTGEDFIGCGGCIDQCEADRISEQDDEALGCMEEAHATALCTPGIEGAQPFIDAYNLCCDGKNESGVCLNLCEVIVNDPLVTTYFPACQSVMGE